MVYHGVRNPFCSSVRLKPGSQPSSTGTIRVIKTKWKEGFRATFTYNGHSYNRKYGGAKPTPHEAAMSLLTSLEDKCAAGEKERITQALNVQLMGPSTNGMMTISKDSECDQGSQPVPKHDGATPGPSTCEACEDLIAFVHQVYGLYGDGKPKSPLFEESRRRWELVALQNGAYYHEWTASEVETLIRKHYPQYWEMYKDCRYPVMRVDMARILILHFYGGLYSDMDVWPNRSTYKRQPFAVCAVPAGLTAKENAYFDMEVLISNPKNPFLLAWMDYIKQQIAERNYRRGVYKTWRARYIYNTTGPYAMGRWLKKVENKDYVEKTMGRISCNRFADYETLTSMQKQSFDVLTRRSNSYFTQEFEIKVPVSTEDVPLPVGFAHSTRLRQKTWVRGTICSQAPSQDATESGGAEPVHAREGTDKDKDLLEKIINAFVSCQRAVNKSFVKHVLEVPLRMDGALVAQIQQRISSKFASASEPTPAGGAIALGVKEGAPSQMAPSQPGTSSSTPPQGPGGKRDPQPQAKKRRSNVL